jgi:hypothetical protein
MKKILVIAAALFANILLAQPIEVYLAKGDVKITTNGKSVTPKEGLVLQSNSIVALAEKAQLVLYQGEKAVVLNGAKTYTYKEIVVQFAETKKSITDRYIAYIWNQAHGEGGADAQMGTSKNNVAGMVSRGGAGITSLVDSSIIISKNFVVALSEEAMPGTVYFYERKKPIESADVDSTFYLVEQKDGLNTSKWIGVAAASNGQAPYDGIVYFKWASEEEIESFYADLSALSEAVHDYPEEMQREITEAYMQENRFVFYQATSK